MIVQKRNREHLFLQKIHPIITESIYSVRNAELSNEWKLIFDKNNSLLVKILWLLIAAFSCITCFYQIYNRIQYFRGDPVTTYITVEELSYIKVPGLVLCNLETDELEPYWPEKVRINHDPTFMQCGSPVRALIKEERAMRNLTKYWHALNTTKNIEKIFLDYNDKVLASVTLKNNSVFESKNLDYFNWYSKYNIQGLTSILELTIPIKVGSKINIVVGKRGRICGKMSMLTTFIANFYIPMRYMVFARFKTLVKISPSIVQYNFVNRISSRCEVKDEVAQNCYKNCLLNKYKNLTCGLPFVPREANLTDCDLSFDKEVVFDTYKFCRSIMFYTSATQTCNCDKPCTENIFYIHTEKMQSDDENLITLQYSFNDLYKTIYTEVRVYDKIALLIDIGGNMGLFLGMSLLSIVMMFNDVSQNYLYNFIKSSTKRKTLLKKKVEQQTKLLINLKAKKDKEKKSKLSKFFFGIVFVVCLIFSIYMLTNNVRFYLHYPVRRLVVLLERKLMQYPNVIVCGEHPILQMYRNQLAKQLHISPCDLHFLDILHFKKIDTLEYLWQLRSVLLYELKLKAVLEISAIEKPRVNITKVMTHSGYCHEMSFKLMSYAGDATGFILSFDPPKNDCNGGQAEYYLHPANATIHSILLSQRKVSQEIVARFVIREFQIVRVNVTRRICGNYDDYEQCKNKCHENKYIQNIKCSLPFLKIGNLSFCLNSTSAKESYNEFIKIVIKTDVHKECNCLIPCTETVYQTFIYLDEPGNPYGFQYVVPYSNYVEVFQELQSYDLVALFCDLGNSLGLTLGLSVLDSLQIVNVMYGLFNKKIFAIRRY